VLALFEESPSYRRPLKSFLNGYLSANQERDLSVQTTLGETFVNAVGILDSTLGPRAFRPERALNAAYLDSITTAVMHAVTEQRSLDGDRASRALAELESDPDFKRATLYDTSAEDAVQYRLQAARAAFGGQ